MLILQLRNLSALASLLGWLLMTPPVHAQIQEVTDHPVGFWNATQNDLSIETIAVIQRNGQEVLMNSKWHFKAGQYSWFNIQGNHVPGVTLTFLLRTPDNRVTLWAVHSQGPSNDGCFRVDFTDNDLRTHQQSMPEKPGYRPIIPTVVQRRAAFLDQQIAGLQVAIQQDEQLLTKQSVVAPVVRIIGELAGPLLEQSKSAADRRAAPVLGPAFEAGGQEIGDQIDRARAATEARLRANRQLLQKYVAELQTLQIPNPGLTPV